MFYSSVLGRLVNVLSDGAARARRVVASQNDSSTSAPSIALIFLTEGIKSARHVRKIRAIEGADVEESFWLATTRLALAPSIALIFLTEGIKSARHVR